jgi:hypothetical protein
MKMGQDADEAEKSRSGEIALTEPPIIRLAYGRRYITPSMRYSVVAHKALATSPTEHNEGWGKSCAWGLREEVIERLGIKRLMYPAMQAASSTLRRRRKD